MVWVPQFGIRSQRQIEDCGMRGALSAPFLSLPYPFNAQPSNAEKDIIFEDNLPAFEEIWLILLRRPHCLNA